jgi:hypothetical protein
MNLKTARARLSNRKQLKLLTGKHIIYINVSLDDVEQLAASEVEVRWTEYGCDNASGGEPEEVQWTVDFWGYLERKER